MQTTIKSYTAFNYESITVSSTAVGLTSSKFADYAAYEIKAFITAEGGDMRWRIDGTAPTATEGHLLTANQNLTLEGYKNLANFKAIRTGTSDGTIRVTYMVA